MLYEWAKQRFDMAVLPCILAGGEDELELAYGFVDRAERMGITPQQLSCMHPDDLRQVFDELNTPSTTRIIVRKVVTFPGDVLETAFSLVKLVAFVVVVSGRLMSVVRASLCRPVPTLAILSSFFALYQMSSARELCSDLLTHARKIHTDITSPSPARPSVEDLDEDW